VFLQSSKPQPQALFTTNLFVITILPKFSVPSALPNPHSPGTTPPTPFPIAIGRTTKWF